MVAKFYFKKKKKIKVLHCSLESGSSLVANCLEQSRGNFLHHCVTLIVLGGVLLHPESVQTHPPPLTVGVKRVLVVLCNGHAKIFWPRKAIENVALAQKQHHISDAKFLVQDLHSP